MNVLEHARNEPNLCLKQNRPDRSHRDTLLIFVGVSGRNSKNNGLRTSALFFSSPRVALRAKYLVLPAWLTKRLSCRLWLFIWFPWLTDSLPPPRYVKFAWLSIERFEIALAARVSFPFACRFYCLLCLPRNRFIDLKFRVLEYIFPPHIFVFCTSNYPNSLILFLRISWKINPFLTQKRSATWEHKNVSTSI